MLNNTQAAPLGNRPKTGRTSLAGVQEKIVLLRDQGCWFQVLDGYPSTHIIKPPSARYPSITFDEEYGLRAAKAVGLTTLDSWIEDFDGVPGLVIERYDRSPDAPQGRVHQEDMNQALGASKNEHLGALLLDIVSTAKAGGMDAERALRTTLRALQQEIREAEAAGVSGS